MVQRVLGVEEAWHKEREPEQPIPPHPRQQLALARVADHLHGNPRQRKQHVFVIGPASSERRREARLQQKQRHDVRRPQQERRHPRPPRDARSCRQPLECPGDDVTVRVLGGDQPGLDLVEERLLVLVLGGRIVGRRDQPQVQVRDELLTGEARHGQDRDIHEAELRRREQPPAERLHGAHVQEQQQKHREHRRPRQVTEAHQIVPDQRREGSTGGNGDRSYEGDRHSAGEHRLLFALLRVESVVVGHRQSVLVRGEGERVLRADATRPPAFTRSTSAHDSPNASLLPLSVHPEPGSLERGNRALDFCD